MNRRSLLTAMLGLTAAPFVRSGRAAAKPGPIRLQTSPLAGFQFHVGEDLWPHLRVGQDVRLVREPSNPHDRDAVRIDWRGHKLGYLPRDENTAVAQLIDRGECLRARIGSLQNSNDPWGRVQLAINLEQA